MTLGASARFLVLDGLRGGAAFAVILWHTGSTRFIPGGYLAVDLFFCLSGFVLAHAYGTTTMTFWNFVKVRLIRLYPLYFLALLLGLLAASLTVIPARWPNVLSALAFLPAFEEHGDVYMAYPFNVPAWSLLFEIVINLIWFPLRGASSRVVSGLAALGIAAIILLISLVGSVDAGWHGANFFAEGIARVTFPFFAGALIFRLWDSGKLFNSLPYWLPAGLMCAMFVMPGPRAIIDGVCVLILVPLIVALGASAREPVRLSPLFKKLGEASYPVYILHSPILLMLMMAAPDVPQRSYLIAAVAILLLLGLSWVTLCCYDRPVRERLAKFCRVRRDPTRAF